LKNGEMAKAAKSGKDEPHRSKPPRKVKERHTGGGLNKNNELIHNEPQAGLYCSCSRQRNPIPSPRDGISQDSMVN